MSIASFFRCASLIVAVGAFPLSAFALDCARAHQPAELTICTDPLLLRLDLALNQNYIGMLASNIGSGARSHLRDTQRQWVRQRNACKDAACILEMYVNRMDEVCEYPVITGIHAICVPASAVIGQ